MSRTRVHATGAPGRRCGLRALLAWLCIAVAVPVAADDLLTCGVPVTRHLDTGGTDSYGLAMSTDAAVVVDAAYTSGGAGYIKLGAAAIGETCSGSLPLPQPTSTTVTVSDCLGEDAGDYAIVANVVADVPDNCGRPLPCGASPHVRGLKIPGQVDAYTFAAVEGDRITITGTDIDGMLGGVNLRLYDPTGALISSGDTCTTVTKLNLETTGLYTVLANACGQPHAGWYGIGFQAPACPAGPDITYVGVAQADGTPQAPVSYDDAGRPIYLTSGSGIYMVIEAQPGRNRTPVGTRAFDHDPTDPTVLPDLQVLLSRTVGAGGTQLCERDGVPAARPFVYAETQTVADTINDFGCQIDDGTGTPEARTGEDACTFFEDGSYHFVNSDSTVQFCTELISRTWNFPPGDTIVKARVRDINGGLGSEREIIVRVDAPQTCAGDCSGDGEVTIDELIVGITIVLGSEDRSLADCPAVDANGDGDVSVDDIVRAVNMALGGCVQ